MYIIHRATCCVWRQEDAQLATERVRDLSNNAAVVTESPNATPSDSKVVVGTSSTIARENNGTGPTKLTNGCDNGANTCSRCRNVSCLCQDAAALRCRQHYLADDTETVVCPPLSVDSRRDMTLWNSPPVGKSDVADCVVEYAGAELGEDDDEACTTTSGSYNAGDLCDEIDEIFFSQNRDRNVNSSFK